MEEKIKKLEKEIKSLKDQVKSLVDVVEELKPAEPKETYVNMKPERKETYINVEVKPEPEEYTNLFKRRIELGGI